MRFDSRSAALRHVLIFPSLTTLYHYDMSHSQPNLKECAAMYVITGYRWGIVNNCWELMNSSRWRDAAKGERRSTGCLCVVEFEVNNVYFCVQAESDDEFDSDSVAILGHCPIIHC